EDDDGRSARDVVLDEALRAVVLGPLAHEEAAQRAQGGGRVGARSLGGPLPGEAGDVADDRVGTDGRTADGVDEAAVAAGEVVDQVENQPGDEVQPLRVEGDPFAVEKHRRSLAGGQEKIPPEQAFL